MTHDIDRLLRDVFPFGLVVRDGAVAGCWLCSDVVRVIGPDGRPAPDRRRSGVKAVMRGRDGRLVGSHVHLKMPDDVEAAALRGLAAAESGVPSPASAHRTGGGGREASPQGQAGIVVNLLLTLAGDLADDPGREARNAGRMLSVLSQLVGSDLGDGPCLAAAQAHSARRADALGRFLETLDRDALRLVGLHGQRMAEDFGEAWDGLDAAVTPTAPLRRALDAHPLLHRTLITEWLRAPVPFARDVAAGASGDAAARGCARPGHVPGRLVPHLAAAEGAFARLPVGERDAVTSMLSDDRRALPLDAPVTLLGLLGALPAGWVPRDDAGWDALLAAGPVLTTASWLVRDVAGWPRLVNSGGRWTEFRARLSAASRGLGLCDAVEQVMHVARAYADQVLTPARAIAQGLHPHASARDVQDSRSDEVRPSSEAYALLFSGRSMPRMLEDSASWHAAAPRIAARVAALADAGDPPVAESWPAAFPGHGEGDLVLVVLTDDASLVSEGGGHGRAGEADGLGHCVGGYGGACRSGRSRIASVRRSRPDGTFERLSTIELAMRDGRPVVLEHKGRANAEPPGDTRDMVARYVDLLRGGRIHVEEAGLAPVPGADSIRSAAGYDWCAAGRWEAVRDAWAPFVPRHLRRLDPGSLARLAASVPFGDDDDGCMPVWSAEPISDAAVAPPRIGPSDAGDDSRPDRPGC